MPPVALRGQSSRWWARLSELVALDPWLLDRNEHLAAFRGNPAGRDDSATQLVVLEVHFSLRRARAAMPAPVDVARHHATHIIEKQVQPANRTMISATPPNQFEGT
jgi:hypothetical protein